MKNVKTLKLVQLAVMSAILILMALTPLGYLRVGAVEISFMMIPVAVGAVIIGPTAGLILGALFGLTSFLQCFGVSAFGMLLMGINPFFTFISCFVTRMLAGWLCGIIYRAASRIKNVRFIHYTIAGLSAALLNTIFFIAVIYAMFGTNSAFISGLSEFGITYNGLFAFFAVIAGTNGILEAVAAAVITTAVCKALSVYMNRKKKQI